MNAQRQMLANFIDVYRERPSLWDPSHADYRNKFIRIKALEELLEVYKEFDPEANIDSVRNKVNIIRSAYNKEKKKVLARPNHRTYLWYYDKLSFLDPFVNPSEEEIRKYVIDTKLDEETRQSVSIIVNKRRRSPSRQETENYETNQSDSDNDNSVSTNDAKRSRTKLKKSGIKFEFDQFESENDYSKNDLSFADEQQSTERIYLFDEEHGGQSQNNSSRQAGGQYNDEFDSFANTVAISLRKLKHPQQAIAQKLISDVIFYSKLNKLTENTAISIPE